jgi:hypothetical protein
LFATRRNRTLALVAVAATSTFASEGLASPRKGARITWARGIDADGCVGATGLEEDVKARLGYDPFALPADLAVEGTIVRAPPAGFRAELIVRDAGGQLLGTRQLASRDAECRSLGEAVAVAITVAIDPDAPGTRAPALEELPPAIVQETPVTLPPPAPRMARRVHALLTGGASAGLLPDVAPSIALRVRAAVGERFEVGVGAHFWPESKTRGVGFSIATGSLDGCFVAHAFRWCAAFHAGAFDVFVHEPALAPVEVGMFPWLAAETGPSFSVPVAGALHLEAGLSAILPILRRQAFVRGTPEPLWEQSVVGGRADVGLGASF